jgi:hypothetical protein
MARCGVGEVHSQGRLHQAGMTARRVLGVTDVIDVSINNIGSGYGTLCALMRGGEIKCMGRSGTLR